MITTQTSLALAKRSSSTGIVATGRENQTKGKPSRAKSQSKSGDARIGSGLDIETQLLSASGRGRSFFLTSLFIELIDCISVGVDRMQRNFESMRKQVDAWQRSDLTDVTAKVVIYEAFVEGKLEAPKQLARTVHDLYFEPKYEEFRPRTIWSLSNAFTSAFKELDPIPQFKATAKLGEFLEARFSQSF
jgi:hypothetical protein